MRDKIIEEYKKKFGKIIATYMNKDESYIPAHIFQEQIEKWLLAQLTLAERKGEEKGAAYKGNAKREAYQLGLREGEEKARQEIFEKFIIAGSMLTMYQTEEAIHWTADELRKSMLRICNIENNQGSIKQSPDTQEDLRPEELIKQIEAMGSLSDELLVIDGEDWKRFKKEVLSRYLGRKRDA